jgi:hypothetical protein
MHPNVDQYKSIIYAPHNCKVWKSYLPQLKVKIISKYIYSPTLKDFCDLDTEARSIKLVSVDGDYFGLHTISS